MDVLLPHLQLIVDIYIPILTKKVYFKAKIDFFFSLQLFSATMCRKSNFAHENMENPLSKVLGYFSKFSAMPKTAQ